MKKSRFWGSRFEFQLTIMAEQNKIWQNNMNIICESKQILRWSVLFFFFVAKIAWFLEKMTLKAMIQTENDCKWPRETTIDWEWLGARLQFTLQVRLRTTHSTSDYRWFWLKSEPNYCEKLGFEQTFRSNFLSKQFFNAYFIHFLKMDNCFELFEYQN